ncbi:penicillin-binding protein 2 [Salibacteraceae bacterium]|jgi:penicillin-binding protein 2|nr:penicillin-binding protein 2 [Salibacteraceae bacterium]MDB4105865.1 penicillin-binding protein 2 [Salibacteraceae bacterium]MDB9708358.1 penicillin-binding protein 2 [Salibacteraceae bacterium]MDC1304609.1 penicillin-binding protein 2 [Salibacteraceae bacterium]HAQ70376.1 penicillin-binding protein 2 [Flavobacteriales bacterium]
MNNLENRKITIIALFVFVSFIFLARLFFIQMIDDSYTSSADNQALRYITQYPARGIIYDRHGKILVQNQAAFDLMVVPRQIDRLDTLSFCELLNITQEEFTIRLTKAKKYSNYRASIFQKQLTGSEYAKVAENLYRFSGFYGQKRTLRIYPDSAAAHVLGYIGEVNSKDIERDSIYKSGDFIGISGLEKQYEQVLRGERGREVLMVDVHNTVQGKYMDGELDIAAKAGVNLISTIDLDLQKYGESLMQMKKGSIVAIEPATGEVLCLVSSPNYDPNLLVGANRAANYQLLAQNDSLDPLFNRALMAKYPPGSIFKIIQALIGLNDVVINENTGLTCNKSLVGCHNHPSAKNLREAIQMSCNPYFHQVFKRLINKGYSTNYFEDSALGLAEWHEKVSKFGLGQRLAIDLPSLKSGSIPDVALYDKIYGSRRWAYSTIYSVSIGQGEVEVVPLQMANLAATVANRGYFIDPHLVKEIDAEHDSFIHYEVHNTDISKKHYEPIIDAMQSVVDKPGGTARRARIDSIIVCGKTGTAENPHGEDHSVFIAFAPRDNPKIAIAVYVENAGFGGTWAAPIASLMIERYINGSVSDTLKESRILDANLLSQPIEN